MVNRLEEGPLPLWFRLLDVGEALVQLNNPAEGPNPVKFCATIPVEIVLASGSRGTVRPAATPAHHAPEPVPVPPPKDDSAWTIYEVLPPWAREAAKLASLTGDQIPTKLLEEIVSKSQAEEMIHGPHTLFTEHGPTLTLTQLGGKVAAIQRSATAR